MAESRRSRPQPVFATDAERLAEAARRKRGRAWTILLVLLGFALLLYALAFVRLPT